jgi:NAD(P)-dependent dehydrogenase (short-subunit alcohol dehydrogenase family)
MTSKTALVTGASRGIGKACAVCLAEAGFDVALAARTVSPGEIREHSVTVRKSDTRPLPGSLEETAAAVEAAGQRAFMLAMDLTDRASVAAGTVRLVDAWGAPDLIVHNGRYVGPGLMDGVLATPVEHYTKFLEAHVIAPIIITQLTLPGMLERGSGTIMTIGSGAAVNEPPAAPGLGGWGLGYGIGKAAGHRLTGHVRAEFGPRGILTFNVDPGYVRTERNALTLEEDGMDPNAGAPPEAVGRAVAWLATSPDAFELQGLFVKAQELTSERGLLPGWSLAAAS